MHELNSCADGTVSRRICSAELASAPIVREWFIFSSRNNRHGKLLAQFSLSLERDVANIIVE